MLLGAKGQRVSRVYIPRIGDHKDASELLYHLSKSLFNARGGANSMRSASTKFRCHVIQAAPSKRSLASGGKEDGAPFFNNYDVLNLV